MEKLSDKDLLAIVGEANLAPSVHNTQPTRWSLEPDGALRLAPDWTRQLKLGDPTGRDLEISVGAALEGTLIALSKRSLVGTLEQGDPLRVLAHGGGAPDPLAAQVPQRMTWRRGFAPATVILAQALETWAQHHSDITLVAAPTEIATISALNERASLALYRNGPGREELVSWMRLSPRDARFGVDGLSAPAMGLSRVEAFGAAIALRQPVFGWLDAVGLFSGLISEQKRTLGSAAVVLFHRPADEHPITTGRALYRRQLELSALGLQIWPMSVLADTPETNSEICDRYGIGTERRLITVWRVGPLPTGAHYRRERLAAERLIDRRH